jgi:hypothetical protein
MSNLYYQASLERRDDLIREGSEFRRFSELNTGGNLISRRTARVRKIVTRAWAGLDTVRSAESAGPAVRA